MEICVFCSSSNYLDAAFYSEAKLLGSLMCNHQHNLVYGGTNIGLMGALATRVKLGNGRVTGVIPQVIMDRGIAFNDSDELIITKNMSDRKTTMHQLGDAFIALPGGFGTLEEVIEVITLKQLRIHNKPIVLINTHGFFNSLNVFFDHMFAEKFASEKSRATFKFVNNSYEAIEFLHNYQPVALQDKWE